MEKASQDCVDLAAACKVLARSEKAQLLVKSEVGAAHLDDALKLMESGTLEGPLGAEIHDLFVDKINNDSQTVWSAVIRGSHDEYPVCVYGYEGVYWAWAMEYSRVGYFLDPEKAVAFARSEWDVTEAEWEDAFMPLVQATSKKRIRTLAEIQQDIRRHSGGGLEKGTLIVSFPPKRRSGKK